MLVIALLDNTSEDLSYKTNNYSYQFITIKGIPNHHLMTKT